MPFGWDCRGDLKAGWRLSISLSISLSKGRMAAKAGFDPCQGPHQLAFQVKMRAHALPRLPD